MQIREERQNNPVSDDVSALVAVTRPILSGLLHSTGDEFLEVHGGAANIRLGDLGRVHRANDGDLGVAFEYSIHDAVLRKEAVVTERVTDALRRCNIHRGDPASILFAMEKNGSKQLVQTQRELITSESRVLTGKQGQPPKLQRYMNQLAAAFHRPTTRLALPQSIRGLWKADLFLGSSVPDHWVGTSIKFNPARLEAAPGLRIAIVPSSAGGSDAIRVDDQRNLVVCPIPHDWSFMQTFHEGMRIIQQLCARDFRPLTETQLPSPTHREVARIYIERRDFPVLDVLDAVQPFAQPELLVTNPEEVSSVAFRSDVEAQTRTAVGPIPTMTS